jgi:hypothetical protein
VIQRRRGLPVWLAACLLVTACAGVPLPSGEAPVEHPGGSAVVARIENTGGLVPYETIFTNMPQVTVLGDGRVILLGPPSDEYPGPALPNVLVRRLTEEGLQSIISRMTETGLFEESQSFTGASQVVADAPSTVFTLRADGREVIVDVYGLGLLAGGSGLPPDVPAEEAAAHETLTELEAAMRDLESWIPADDWADAEWQPYVPTAMRLLVTNVDDQSPIPEAPAEPLPWPGSTPPDEMGEPSPVQNVVCGLVMGEEAAEWFAALGEATQLHRWSHDGHEYRVTPRPLLPDEVLDCGPDAA